LLVDREIFNLDSVKSPQVHLVQVYYLEKSQHSIMQIEDQAFTMDHHNLQELKKILRTHEEMVQGNKASILTLITKFHEYGQQCISQIAKIMSTLVQVKQQLVILEE
jgi:hypothetical protein